MPAEDIKDNLHLIDRKKPTIVYCYEQHCHLAKNCIMILLENYFPTIELEGGFKSWKDHGYDIIKTDSNI